MSFLLERTLNQLIMFIRLFSWIGIALGCAFTCYCLAAGLYLIGEFIEEYNVFARKSLVITIAVLSVVHAIFLLELNILCNMYSMVCLGIYYVFINDFPQLTPVALGTLAVLGITNHISWFYYFSSTRYPLSFIVTWFMTSVWLGTMFNTVPFSYFISYNSANGLPQAFNQEQKKKGWLKMFVNSSKTV